MYNSQIIAKNRDRIEKQLKIKLVEYSVDITKQAQDKIESLIDIDLYKETIQSGEGKIQFKSKAIEKEFKSKDIQQFILNEKILCKIDANYWTDRYYIISDATNKFIQFSPNPAQKIQRAIESKLEGLGIAIRKLILKARQLGLTTYEIGRLLHRLLFYSDIKSLMASKKEEDTLKMSRILIDALNRQPFYLNPQFRSYRTGDHYLLNNNSLLDLGWGTQKSLGKGTTPTISLCTEIALFKYPVDAIENGLIRAMHESPRLYQSFEGTAEQRDDWLHKKVVQTIKQMEDGTTSLYFIFLPWFLREDLYPTKEWIRARSNAFSKYIPSTETIVHAKKVENNIRTSEYLRNVLGLNWQMNKEQMFFYETERNAAINENRLHVFLSQMPADWEEAFQNAGRTIYPIEVITRLSDNAQQNNPSVYMLRGDPNEINPELFPQNEDIDTSREIINIRANWANNVPFSDFELVPTIFNGWDKFNPKNKILIWEDVREDFEYGISVDTSDGLGEDISDDAIIEVIRKGDIERRDRQVCEFSSPEIPQLNFWPFLMAISTLYSPRFQSLVTIEINKGYELQNIMINRGWHNLYKRAKMDKVSSSRYELEDFGFHTGPTTRPDLINFGNSFIKGNWIDLYSMPLVSEIKDLTKKRTISPVLGAINEKILGNKDNRFMALLIGLYALHRDEIMGLEKKSWETRIRNENSRVEYASTNIEAISSFGNLDRYKVTEEGTISWLEEEFSIEEEFESSFDF